MAWGTLRTRAGALPFSFSDLGFAFSTAELFGFAAAFPGTLPLGAALDLGFSTLAAPARSTRFAAGALSASGEAARFETRVRDSGGAAVLAARARLGGMVGGGGCGKRSEKCLWQSRESPFLGPKTRKS